MDIDKRNLSIIERLEELRDLMKIGMDKVTLQDAMDEIERLREALADLVAVQNGPPLVTYTEAWDAAMEKAYAALKEKE